MTLLRAAVAAGRGRWQERVAGGRFARTQETSLDGDSVPVVRRVDLILLKLFAGGPQDAWDIEQLLAVPERAALEREVEQQLAPLPEACVSSGPGFGEGDAYFIALPPQPERRRAPGPQRLRRPRVDAGLAFPVVS